MFNQLQQIGIGADIDFILRLIALVMARMLGAALQIPFMGGQLIPGQIKFGIPLVFSVFLYPFVEASVDHAAVPAFGLYFAGVVAKEIFIGTCLGFVVSLPFYAVEAAGSFMDTQRGTTFAQTIAPFLGGQASLLGNLYILLFMTLFLGMGGNHLVIGGIFDSYRVLPLTGFPSSIRPGSPFVDDVLRLSGDLFAVGLKISAPVVVAMFLTDATLGVINRVAPNVQVFWLGMPIKTLSGLVIVFVAIGFLSDIFGGLTIGIVVAMRRAANFLAAGT
jgi:flagellar biosynthetic protein FliR